MFFVLNTSIHKNVSQLLLVHSGLDSHRIQYMQKAHELRERFALILGRDN